MIGTEGQVNRMSDDLISRKAVLNILTEARVKDSILCSPAFVEILTQRIKKISTAFDKEKVIEKLRSEAQRWHESGIEFKDENEKGVAAGFRLATHIVEKGGIEFLH